MALSSDEEDRRAGRPARLQVSMGLTRVLQRIALVDFDRDATGGDVAEQLAGQVVFLSRLGDVVSERRARQIERAFHREQLRIEWRGRSGGGADADQQAAPPQRIERGVEGVLADAVETALYA